MLRAVRDKQRGIHKYLLVTWISRNAIWSTEIKRQEHKRKKGEKEVLIMFKWFGTLVKFVFRVKESPHIPFKLVDHSSVISMRIFQKKQAWVWLCLTAPITLNSCQNEKHYGFVHFLLYIWTGISGCKCWNGFYFQWTHVSQPPANPFISSYWSISKVILFLIEHTVGTTVNFHYPQPSLARKESQKSLWALDMLRCSWTS